ncbi:baseplate J/gp47 family protein [Lachnospiraceae bacterium 64-25]
MSLKALENYPDISFIGEMTLEEMKEQMISDFQKKYEEITGKPVVLGKADPVRLILYAASLQLYQGMQYIDNAAKQSFLKYSYGGFLENLGALKGITRNQGTPAQTMIRFTLSEARNTASVIPKGTRVTPGGNIFFYTEEERTILPGDMSVDIPAVCTDSGECGNDYDPGSIKVLVDKIPYVAEVVNLEKTYGGAEVESDESLAERIYLAPSKYSVAGPDDAYQFWTRTCNPSITDVKVSSPVPGNVDIRFTINNGEIPPQEMVEEVESYLMEGERRPLTDLVTVGAPETVEFNVNVKYWINETDRVKAEAVRRSVNEAIDGFAYWQRKQIGRDINPSMLNHLIIQAGAKRTEITEPMFTVVGETGLAVMASRKVVYGGLERD